MMFSARYQPGNPSLPRLDKAYRELADNMREASCQGCHSPDNSSKMKQLILLQTPLRGRRGGPDHQERYLRRHAGERNGPAEDIDPKLRASILRSPGVQG